MVFQSNTNSFITTTVVIVAVLVLQVSLLLSIAGVVVVVSANNNDGFVPKVTSDQKLYYIGETIQFTQVTTDKDVVRNHFIVSEYDVPTLLRAKSTGSLLPSWYYINCEALDDTTPTPAPIPIPTSAPLPPTNNTNPVPSSPVSSPPDIPIICTRNIVCSFTWNDIYSINMFLSNFEYTKESEYSKSTKVLSIKDKIESTKFVYVDLNPRNDNSLIVQSNTFQFKVNNINITLNKSTYVPGEIMQLTFEEQFNNVPDPSYNEQHYVKIYQVPFSYKDDVSKFNTAKQVKYVSYNTSTTSDHTTSSSAGTSLVLPITKQLISWEESGTYQIVIFQKHYQVIIAISETFTVQPISNMQQFDVKMNNNKYYPHQDIVFDITLPTSASYIGRDVTFTFVQPRVQKHQIITDPSKILDIFTQTWTSASMSQQFTLMNTLVQRGYYKILVSINSVSGENNFHIQTSKVFQVLSPLITMTTTPSQRKFTQGEVIEFKFYNPYFNFNIQRENYYYGYVSHIVKVNFPSNSKVNNKIMFPDVFFHLPLNGYDVYDDNSEEYYQDNNLLIVLPPGYYRIAIFRIVQKPYDECDLSVEPRDIIPFKGDNTPLSSNVATFYQSHGTHFDVETVDEEYMTAIANTTFLVLANIFTVTTDKDMYKMNETISVQLSSSRNIALSTSPHITWELRSIVHDELNYPGYHTLIGVFEESSISSTVLACKIPVTWSMTGVFSLEVSNGLARKEITIR